MTAFYGTSNAFGTIDLHSPLKMSPQHRNPIFQGMSPVGKMGQHQSIFTGSMSPNLRVVTTDWSGNRRGGETASSGQERSAAGSPNKRTLRRTNTADRFIPARHTVSGRLNQEENVPLPYASPSAHIESQSQKIYQNTVAEACGLDVSERILQFQPAPPESRKPADLKSQYRSSVPIQPSVAHARAKRVPTNPEKVLDAPGIVDDFYLNLLAWSSLNVLAVALEDAVYVWNASTGSVESLGSCNCLVTSVRWSDDGYYLSVGKNDGSVELYDVETLERVRTMKGHEARVGSQCWNQHILTSGSRSGRIFNHDVRQQQHIVATLDGHSAEVCGIEWRSDGEQLATGGNDNVVNVWDARSSIPKFTKTAHNAAVKALSWCPTQQSLLATGGGAADKQIHFWNTTVGARVNTIDVGHQVSSLRWGYANGIGKEICATHGSSYDNGVSVYAYPSLQKTGAIAQAHELRILNSALSPDGITLATVSADENLKFWKLFDCPKKSDMVSSLTTGKAMGKVMTIR
ncbi:unnamed protein product [Kuraishia capsulata CBS 1993]|uniref:CDC20/Fizzy WD40 domain-containing protein n=1 Tax=Kuraishia capsulata CBS 1993 TaxID=1382522 RepID=W6MWE3_9ASCO|nr:uncharacterized protein KUCA_T00003273001 [Kuraishia capsulata CBS 1993]CDK27295.1 unnamed protein product [Kuraishia capsulata CBS 1993]